MCILAFDANCDQIVALNRLPGAALQLRSQVCTELFGGEVG
jgi:hypothetical protein